MSVSNNKFSHELETSKRTRNTELHASLAELGAWNPDATDASRSERDFAEFRNMRKMRPNEAETRSGYKQWRFGPWTVPGIETTKTITPTAVLKNGEYRLDSVFVDITLFSATNSDDPLRPYLCALIVYPSNENVNTVGTGTQSQKDVAYGPFSQLLVIAPCGKKPVVAAMQFGTYFTVSLLARDLADPADTQMFALSPAANDPTRENPWTITALGKQVSPCPNNVNFSATIQGNLLVIPSQPFDVNAPVFNPQIDPVTNSPITIPLKINADYFLVSGHPLYPAENPWEFGKTDTPSTIPPTAPFDTISTGFHTKSRGWMYRVVLRSKFNDARGQEHIELHAPSADFYVPDMTYGPAGLGVMANNILVTPDQIDLIFPPIPGTGMGNSKWRDKPGDPFSFDLDADLLHKGPGFLVGNQTPAIGFPDPNPPATAYFVLRNKFRALFPTISDGDSLFFAAAWLGWVGSSRTPTRYVYPNGQPPYLLNATSYQVNNAPNVIFNWADFGVTDSTAYAIDIYRTTYTLPDESKDLAAGLPYQPYNYGFVGTLYKTDQTFTDNIADANLLFSRSPLDAEGFLVGELAGEVFQKYQGSLVALNVRSKYRVRTPWQGAQAFLVGPVASGNGYTSADFGDTGGGNFTHPPATFPVPSGGGLHWKTSWYYAYQDQDGVLSNASYLQMVNYLDNSPPTIDPATAPINAVFVLPRGYSTIVTSAVVYRVVYDDSTKHYDVYRETTVQLMNGIYISDSLIICTPPPAASSNWIGTINLVGSASQADINGFVGTIGVNADGTLNLSTLTSTDDPGSYFWSEPDDPWNWPQKNFENGTDQDPITGAESEIGPLYIFSDKSIVMTRLNGYQEPVHTSGTGAGCLSRYALIKIQADLFTLSSSGLNRIDGSGSFAFPANISSEIWNRIQEKITGLPPFAGIRNLVSIGYLPRRNEMFVTFPDTSVVAVNGPYAGKLPATTFIVKTLVDTLPDNPYRDEINRKFSYQFDLAVPTPPALQTNPPIPGIYDVEQYVGGSPQPTGLVIHLTHADGGLWSTWFDPGDLTNPDPHLQRQPALVIQDNDRPEFPWPGQASIQWQNAMGAPGIMKRIDGFRFNAEVACDLYFMRGMLRTDAIIDPLNNTLRPECQARQVAIQGSVSFPFPANDQFLADPGNPNLLGNTAEYTLPIAHDNSVESVGTPPAIRLVTRCVTDQSSPLFNQHMFRIQSMDVWYDTVHNHKP